MNAYPRAIRWIALPILICVCIPCHAEITLDGTMGPAGSLTGPDFQISAELGRQMGSNLFHSFGVFNLNQTESATFTGPSSIANVLARVTEGRHSNIDGTIATSFANAAPNLFFMNPAGVVFGPNARLDVQGSFHVSTAGFLEFGDGSRFNANPFSGDALLTTAPPTAFGFLGEIPTGDITINGSDLEVPLRATFSMVGGNITVSGGRVAAASGRLEVKGQTLTVKDGGRLETDSTSFDNAGSIMIKTGRFVVQDGGEVSATTRGVGMGGSIDIHATNVLLTNGGSILAESLSRDFDAGESGNINIEASDTLGIFNGSSVSVETQQATAGDITLEVGSLLHLNNQGSITTSAREGEGDGGDINIDPIFVILEGGSRIVARAREGGGGNINIVTDFLFLSLDSVIDASSELGTGVLSPVENIITSALELPESFLTVPILSSNPCAVRFRGGASTFVIGGRGIPFGPDRLLVSYVSDLVESLRNSAEYNGLETSLSVPPAMACILD